MSSLVGPKSASVVHRLEALFLRLFDVSHCLEGLMLKAVVMQGPVRESGEASLRPPRSSSAGSAA